jgi:hypothetical protein
MAEKSDIKLRGLVDHGEHEFEAIMIYKYIIEK